MKKDKLSLNIFPKDLDGRKQVWIHGMDRFETHEAFMKAVRAGEAKHLGVSMHITFGFREIEVTSWISGDEFDRVKKHTMKY